MTGVWPARLRWWARAWRGDRLGRRARVSSDPRRRRAVALALREPRLTPLIPRWSRRRHRAHRDRSWWSRNSWNSRRHRIAMALAMFLRLCVALFGFGMRGVVRMLMRGGCGAALLGRSSCIMSGPLLEAGRRRWRIFGCGAGGIMSWRRRRILGGSSCGGGNGADDGTRGARRCVRGRHAASSGSPTLIAQARRAPRRPLPRSTERTPIW